VHEFITRGVQDASFLETLSLWAFMIVGPVWLITAGIRALTSKRSYERNQRSGTLYLIGGLLSTGVVALLLLTHGWQLLVHTRASLGPWVYGVLIALILCVVALPICWAGFQFRSAWECRRLGKQRRGNRSALAKALGCAAILVLITALGGLLVSWKLALAFVAFSTIAGVVGWFGGTLVPEL